MIIQSSLNTASGSRTHRILRLLPSSLSSVEALCADNPPWLQGNLSHLPSKAITTLKDHFYLYYASLTRNDEGASGAIWRYLALNLPKIPKNVVYLRHPQSLGTTFPQPPSCLPTGTRLYWLGLRILPWRHLAHPPLLCLVPELRIL